MDKVSMWECEKPMLAPAMPALAPPPRGPGEGPRHGRQQWLQGISSATMSADEGQAADPERPQRPPPEPKEPASRESPSCMRDPIFQAIEITLQCSMMSGHNGPQCQKDERGKAPQVQNSSAWPEGLVAQFPGHVAPQEDYEVQDLSKKSSQEPSPPVRREKPQVVPYPGGYPQQQPQQYASQPPPAHSNHFRRTPEPLFPPHGMFALGLPRGGCYGGPPDQGAPLHLVTQSLTPHSLAKARAKGAVPPPPPLVAASEPPLSPKLLFKEKVLGGSITHDTPLNQPAGGFLPHCEGLLRQLTPPQEGLAKKRHEDPRFYDHLEQYYRTVGSQGFVPDYSPAFQPKYLSESQLGTNQIMTDFHTSKQMRRGSLGADARALPQGWGPSLAPVVLHPVYQVPYFGPQGAPPLPVFLQHESPPHVDWGHRDPVWAGKGMYPGAAWQDVICSGPWGRTTSVIQAPKTGSFQGEPPMEAASLERWVESLHMSQPYPAVSPSSLDRFTTLVNTAAAQPSLVVPKEENMPSLRKRPAVEGLENSLLEMHQWPRQFRDMPPPLKDYREAKRLKAEEHFMEVHRDEMVRQQQQQQVPQVLRMAGEPLRREQFKLEMRQQVSRDKMDHQSPKRPPPAFLSHTQQVELDNEALRIFLQCFQKDSPEPSLSTQDCTMANVIDAVITHQIDQNTEPKQNPGATDTFLSSYSPAGEPKWALGGPQSSPQPQSLPPRLKHREEVVTIEDGPSDEQRLLCIEVLGEKVITLNQHTAAIISNNTCNPSDSTAPLYSHSRMETAMRTCYAQEPGMVPSAPAA